MNEATPTAPPKTQSKGLFSDDEDPFSSSLLSKATPTATPTTTAKVKKPAGAVSIFGGVDVMGEGTKSTEEGGGAKKEAPPTSRKPRKNSGLFGDMEGGDEDIFAFSGKKR